MLGLMLSPRAAVGAGAQRRAAALEELRGARRAAAAPAVLEPRLVYRWTAAAPPAALAAEAMPALQWMPAPSSTQASVPMPASVTRAMRARSKTQARTWMLGTARPGAMTAVSMRAL